MNTSPRCDECRRTADWKWGRYRLCDDHYRLWLRKGLIEPGWAKALRKEPTDA